MAKRVNITLSRGESAQSPEAPNAVVPAITIEFRVAWPAGMGHESRVRELVEEAFDEAMAQLEQRTAGYDSPSLHAA